MEKFCPVCSRVYGEEATTCEVDGERLVILREEPSLVGHVLDGKYTLHAKLGEGGMGSVYLAEQATMGREVAIKVLRREFSQNRMAIKRFLREARAASKLTHPNTITVYDFGQSNDGLLYLVMERLTGRPLGDILDDDGAMTVERAIHIMTQVCDSLSEAHSVGITHRDLKPENIFIEQKAGNPDFVKVLDFGIAKMQGDESTQATATGMICGTPSYMSPEQAMGRDIDGRSDIYALGILLYEMLTDEKPFDGDTPMEVMLKHINEPAPNVYARTGVAIPQGIQDVLDQMLAKKTPQRPADCQVVKAGLLAGLGTPLAGPVTSTVDPSVPPRRRKETSERAASLEKTGLSPTVTPESFGEIPVAKKPSRRWLWVALLLLLAGGATGAIIAASGGAVPARTSDVVVPRLDPAQPPTAEGATARATPPIPTPTEAADPGADQASDDETAAEGVDGVEIVAGAAAGEAIGVVVERAIELAPSPRVTLRVESDPSGAEVFEGETMLGLTPYEFVRPRDSGEVVLTVKKSRYATREVTLDTRENVVQSVALGRSPAAGNVRRPPQQGGGDKKEPGGEPTGEDKGSKLGVF